MLPLKPTFRTERKSILKRDDIVSLVNFSGNLIVPLCAFDYAAVTKINKTNKIFEQQLILGSSLNLTKDGNGQSSDQ